MGCDIERDFVVSGQVVRHEPTVIRPAIAVVAAVTDVDAAVADREAGSLLDVQRVLRSARIGIHRHLDRPGREIQTDELMMDPVGSRLAPRRRRTHG